MKDKIELLKSWISTGQVVTQEGRNIDDLMTLVNQIELSLAGEVEAAFEAGIGWQELLLKDDPKHIDRFTLFKRYINRKHNTANA